MPTKKKTTTTRAKRPPRQVWIALEANGKIVAFGATKRATEESDDALASSSARVVGPYVLAERARER